MDTIDLSDYDSSEVYPHMIQSINNFKNNKLGLTNTSYLINFENKLLTYDENCLYRYRGLLSQNLINVKINETYYYKPELVAKKIYGTVDLSYLIMWFNDIPSVMEFNRPVVKAFNPMKFEMINTIIESERKKIIANNKEPQLVKNLIIKEVKIREY